ncbi:glycosyltransferase family 2 protein [Fulvivirga lutimaris]|uniref:glycosyltransferase family 2 protein n=1 Tax=Fulvivirga lutimaris TaxID=1819566 RepID=UPI0012BC162A|nr:glycosyltransferase family 2 protein [Fulvivirga lutimaris]MTI40903.1 glycosyltransferase family 2 protein [Fulvivirga lutimaris]
MQKKVYVIIVTYNGSKWIRKCLDAVLKSTIPINVLVIDNCSTDNTVEIIKAEFSVIRLLEQQENLGFGRANNVGLRLALNEGADYFLLLNQDAYVENNMIEKLVDVFESDMYKTGIVSPLHQSVESNLDFGFQDHVKRYASSESYQAILSRKEGVYDTNFVNAACWLLCRNTVETVGLFNPLFPHYGEDNDFVNRLKYFGLGIRICAYTFVVHDREQSQDLRLGKLIKRETVSFFKHFSNVNSSPFKALVTVLDKWIRETIYYLITGRWKRMWAVNVAWFSMWVNLVAILKAKRNSKMKGAYL